MSEQSKSQPSTPVKMCRRASIVSSCCPVKEKGNTDSSPDKIPHPQKSQEINEKRKSINENKIEEESHVISSSVLSILNEICQLSEKMDEVHSKHVVITTVDKNEFLGKEGNISGKNVPPAVDTITSEPSTHNTSFSKYKKVSGAKTENNLAENEQPPNDTFKNSAAKEIGLKIENLLNISGEEKRKSSSNKENQMINVINETSTEKNVGPIISNVTSLSTKHLTSVFTNKSLNEKEIKSVINEATAEGGGAAAATAGRRTAGGRGTPPRSRVKGGGPPKTRRRRERSSPRGGTGGAAPSHGGGGRPPGPRDGRAGPPPSGGNRKGATAPPALPHRRTRVLELPTAGSSISKLPATTR